MYGCMLNFYYLFNAIDNLCDMLFKLIPATIKDVNLQKTSNDLVVLTTHPSYRILIRGVIAIHTQSK
jgi:hypothetical protein